MHPTGPKRSRCSNRIVTAEPEWAEAYFVRAGVLANMAGDGSTMEALGTLDRRVDYGALASVLERSAKDLDRYLALDTNAGNRDQVRAAIGALEARAIVARNNERQVAAEVAAETRAPSSPPTPRSTGSHRSRCTRCPTGVALPSTPQRPR